MAELTGGAAGLDWAAIKAIPMFAVAVAAGTLIAGPPPPPHRSRAAPVVLVTLLLAHRAITGLRRRHWLGPLVDAPPRVLIAQGQPQHRELARAGLTLADVYALLREHQLPVVEDVKYQLYESRGTLTVVTTGDRVGPLIRDGLEAAHVTIPDPSQPARRHRLHPIPPTTRDAVMPANPGTCDACVVADAREVTAHSAGRPDQGLVVRSEFFALDWTLKFGRTIVTIDGDTCECPWGEHFFRVEPGSHQLEVSYHLLRMSRAGKASTLVDVAPSEIVHVCYRAPRSVLVAFRPGKLTVAPRIRP